MMTYARGDLVYPADLPRRVLCRILRTEHVTMGAGTEQILKLEPLEGQQWHPGTCLVRRADAVLPARLGDLWRAGMPVRRELHPHEPTQGLGTRYRRQH